MPLDELVRLLEFDLDKLRETSTLRETSFVDFNPCDCPRVFTSEDEAVSNFLGPGMSNES